VTNKQNKNKRMEEKIERGVLYDKARKRVWGRMGFSWTPPPLGVGGKKPRGGKNEAPQVYPKKPLCRVGWAGGGGSGKKLCSRTGGKRKVKCKTNAVHLTGPGNLWFGSRVKEIGGIKTESGK